MGRYWVEKNQAAHVRRFLLNISFGACLLNGSSGTRIHSAKIFLKGDFEPVFQREQGTCHNFEGIDVRPLKDIFPDRAQLVSQFIFDQAAIFMVGE